MKLFAETSPTVIQYVQTVKALAGLRGCGKYPFHVGSGLRFVLNGYFVKIKG